MALKIRLRQQGRKNRQTYRVVLIDSRTQRGGKYLEMLGWYNPFEKENNISMNADRMRYWIGMGAQPSEVVEGLMSKATPDVVDVLKEVKTQRLTKRTKLAAKRRAVKKKSATPAAQKKPAAKKKA